MQSHETGHAEDAPGTSRRRFIAGAGIGAAAAWAAPAILSIDAAAANTVLAPRFIGVSTGTAPAGIGASNLNLARPVGTLAGDLLIVVTATATGVGTTTPPAGWTQITPAPAPNDVGGIGANVQSRVYYRIAGAEAGPYTFAVGSGLLSGRRRAVLVAYRNVNATTPIDAIARTASPNGVSHTYPSVTTTGIERRIVRIGMAGSGGDPSTLQWGAAPEPGVRVANFNTGDTGSRTITVSDDVQQLSGASGTVAQSINVARVANVYTIAINPL